MPNVEVAGQSESCQIILTKIHKELFGNGSPGLSEKVEKHEKILFGDMDHDGIWTLFTSIDTRLSSIETRPRSIMLKIKDVILILTFLFLALEKAGVL